MRGPRTYQLTCATCRSASRPLYAGRTWLQKAKVCAGWCNTLGNFLCSEPISALSLLRGAIPTAGKAARGRADAGRGRKKRGARTRLKKQKIRAHGQPPGRLLRRSSAPRFCIEGRRVRSPTSRVYAAVRVCLHLAACMIPCTDNRRVHDRTQEWCHGESPGAGERA